MICFVANDLKTSVDLLQQDDPHHLVGKSHGRKRQLEISPFAHRRGQSQRTADDEDDAALPLKPQLLDLCRKLSGGETSAADLQRDHVVGRSDPGEDRLAFSLLDRLLVCGGRVGGQRTFPEFRDLQRGKTPEPLGILRLGVAPVFFF